MRLECKNYEDAERLSRLFGESHIESRGSKCYLVVDKARRRKMAVA